MLNCIALLVMANQSYYEAPAGDLYAKVVAGGVTILPNGRFLTPHGKRLYTGEDLWRVLKLPGGGGWVAFSDDHLTVFHDGSRRVVNVPGLAPAGVFSKDGSQLIVSLGDKGSIQVLDSTSWEAKATIDLNDDGEKEAYANDLALSEDGKRLYAVDVARQKLITIDLDTLKVVSSVPAGREPYALVRSLDGKSLFVANIGLFDYTAISRISRPAFGFPSRESEEGTEFEGKQVPGIGKSGSPDAQSIWRYSLVGSQPTPVAKAVSGLLIHSPADGGKTVGGSAPNAILLAGNDLFVSNANNDTVGIHDAATLKLKATIRLAPAPGLAHLRGVIPSAMCLSGDGRRVFVCESGLNAVAVIDRPTRKVVGHIPTGWFPTSIVRDGNQLAIGCQKGIGRGPKGHLDRRPSTDERYGLDDMPGMIDLVTAPTNQQLAGYTAEVLRNNGLVTKKTPAPASPMPYVPGKPSDQIKYVVFITKENHTFDGIFGGLKGAKGQPEYAEFGMNGWIREKGKDTRVPIMPNHIRLAEQFGISDNFYMEPQASGDGHRWLNGVYPSLWTTRVFYAGWDFHASNKAKGRLVSFGSNGSPIPEDYLENGSLWDHLDRNGVSFRNYGEGFEFPGVEEDEPKSRSGAGEVVNFPMPQSLYKNTCFEYPIFNMNIPDIARADWFVQDLEKNYRKKGKPLPHFMNIAICNDHGTRPNPKQGYPYFGSWLADNDLALGRIVEYLSHLPEWKNMAIFVTQDDSGGDDDHVDRHRSFVLAISPYAKRGYVSHRHTSIMSIIKSIYLMFGLGPNNLFDATATGLNDMFTTKPNYTPYKHVLSDPRVFVPENTLDPDDPKFEKRRRMPSVKMDDPAFIKSIGG